MSGFRYNKGKPRMSLLPFDALYELASLFTESMKKYPARNWERGLSWSETQDALLRHLTKWSNKEDIDGESGFNHDVHILWNAIVLVTMRLRGTGGDDRKDEPQLNAIGDDVPGHTIEGHSSNPVAVVTASDEPTTIVVSGDLADVMGPHNYCTLLSDGRSAIVDPLSGKIKAWVVYT